MLRYIGKVFSTRINVMIFFHLQTTLLFLNEKGKVSASDLCSIYQGTPLGVTPANYDIDVS